MSTNGKPDERIPIQCPACGQAFSAKMPAGEFFNNILSSGIVAPHERFEKCPKCRQAFVMAITGAQLDWIAQPVPPEVVEAVEGTKIIAPRLLSLPH